MTDATSGTWPEFVETVIEQCGGALTPLPTTTVWVADPVPLAESVAVSTNRYVPTVVYLCEPSVPFKVVPSPQFSTVLTMLFSGSEQLPLAFTDKGAGPALGATLRTHVGGAFLLLTLTSFAAEPVRPPASVAVSVTVNLPGAPKV